MRTLMIISGMIFICASGYSATWYVPDDFPTIQGAISDEIVMNGDTIIVKPGTYMEAIDFLGKAITVKSKQGPSSTIVGDSASLGSLVNCVSGEGPDSILDGFTIKGGEGSVGPYGGTLATYGGGMIIYQSSPTVKNCVFLENHACTGGGLTIVEGDPTVTNCSFIRNVVRVDMMGGAGNGGGVAAINQSNPTITNSVFVGNTAANRGGGLEIYQSSATIVNNTFSQNEAYEQQWEAGGGIHVGYQSVATVVNTILWEDESPNGPEVYLNWTATLNISYSDVEGGQAGVYVDPGASLNWGPGMIDADPLFLDPLNDDFHLTYASPCIDAGDNYAPSLPATDFEGDPRIFPGNGKGVYLVGSPPQPAIVDMGADEHCLLKRQVLK